MTAFTQPVVLEADGSAKLLDLIPRERGAEGQFEEKWLQTTLFKYPICLPVKEIDPHIGLLIPVGMEIVIGSGRADILYVTPSGQVVLVETKLWRNHQARREVVVQIFEYARQLTSWTFTDLDRAAATSAKDANGYLLRCAKTFIPDLDEASFEDGVNKSLSTGDILLLIVGDGIRSDAEALVKFFDGFGHLRFRLGMVEVAAYRLENGAVLLQPRILAKTVVLERTLILGPNGRPVGFEQLAQADDALMPSSSQRDWFNSFWNKFISKLRLDDPALMPIAPANSTNQFFPMPPGGGNCWISAYVARSSKRAGVYLTFLKGFELAPDMYEDLLSNREAIDEEMGGRLSWGRTENKVEVSVPVVTFNDLDDPAERERVTAYLADQTERLIKVFRPRLEALSRELK